MPHLPTTKMRPALSLLKQASFRFPKGFSLPIPKEKKVPQVSDTHPLWQFFRNKNALSPPDEESKYGRSWTAEELRWKSFDDLHGLWYNCLRERNLLLTQATEMKRLLINVPDYSKDRVKTVNKTMATIKFVLWERERAYQAAKDLEKKESEKAKNPNQAV
ncbi:ribosomal protein subunit L4 [Schizosaccharomyces cryophilus OY26]|uniref:Large ribosomal subunit protein uL29m n=1 Tax=Schizosaccharomyces cryophilus (strain OY26 / ATCC MYA-4695 / CBS 11777 / NBRC 106824 / NRRL Y48691) TaxID=653667 RepID=S9X866_SCHCR|nr:ribosomal protein subunit L4 [Schizosaccharomyces cryophilus OY26]EPY49961.1 ribosomal protein subunit L4 [Schizosaccharomyces cryophilus OY26]